MVATKLAQHETTFTRLIWVFSRNLIFPSIKSGITESVLKNPDRQFPLSALMFGDVKLQEIDIQNLKLSENAQNAATIQMRFLIFP